ncbi:DNA polymerase III subunit alpha [Rhodoferax sp. 4810]|uniref:DNA polymerase III subunit alpha n=1 Tax=Thiospirillum jenense TaxID=1653858 RepID=A0A839H8K2_9GAMM|nr:DNA polymerase III subunit alpha [Rhodoferax jenense]MBB1125735.1 DNA polymerase III subunit alpha [Thiospirillum jenense]
MATSFVHLHLHSEFSLVDGLVRINPLMQHLVAADMPAVAITDENNLFCLIRFYRAALQAGIKPIAGSELFIRNPEQIQSPHRLVLLAQNLDGYRNLTRLISRAYLECKPNEPPQLDRSWLTPSSTAGLIALSAGIFGDVGRALITDQYALAEQALTDWLQLFDHDRYYLELTRTGRANEETCLNGSVELAIKHGVPVVATNDVRFLRTNEFDAHEVRVCIHEGNVLSDQRRIRHYTPQQFLRTPAEMIALFADLPEAIANSVEIAKRCSLELTLGKSFLPNSHIPTGQTVDEYFSELAYQGLNERLTTYINAPAAANKTVPMIAPKQYATRLQIELNVICQMGFPGYFLIVADFIRWAKQAGIPVGPGRGSGAGSLVAYALGITDLDPIEHELLFERFLNPERVSMPDFDIDFCMEGRDRVIEYVANKYGRDAVSQIITFGTMAAKAVVRDVGRVLGQPYGFVDKVAKMVPFELGMTLEKALAESAELKQAYQQDNDVAAMIDMAKQLEGLVRNVGKHAGGVVIAPTQLTDFAPLYCEPGGANLVTQFDKDDIEKVGLVKFDFLGLRTLTIIDWALKTINADRAKRQQPGLDINHIDPHDPQAFALLKRCETTAVFQLESAGMKELIKKLRPDNFADMTALIALFRPGPLQSGMVDDFIARKHGKAAVAYSHPALEPILKSTYGVILYQEQVMQIAQVLAGYSLGGADLLRRAMGKKNADEMAKQRATFEQGAAQNHIPAPTATAIFDLMEKFSAYGFNRSHSAAYALIAYQTLWLKAHYPAAFMAAVLSADMDDMDKVVIFIDECRALKLPLLPPTINQSEWRFTAVDERRILYGLGAIKGVGEAAIDNIISTRRQDGVFTDLWDFCRRLDQRKVNRRVLEALIRSGALDGLAANRATLMQQLPTALKYAEQHATSATTGQNDLFGSATATDKESDHTVINEANTVIYPEWDDNERLKGEKDTLGLYLTGHPLNSYDAEMTALSAKQSFSRLCDIARNSLNSYSTNYNDRQETRTTVIGLVIGVRLGKTQRGRVANVMLDDRTGRIEIAVFSELYDQVREKLVVDQILVVTGILNFDSFHNQWSLRATSVRDFMSLRTELAERVVLELDLSDPVFYQTHGMAQVTTLIELLNAECGTGLSIQILYRSPTVQARFQLGRQWRLLPTDAVIKRLRQLLGANNVIVTYERGSTHYKKSANS